MPTASDDYVETGGLSWGPVLWGRMYGHWNATWPFAQMTVSSEGIRIRVKNWMVPRFKDVTIELAKTDVTAVRRKRALFSAGALFEHRNADAPSRIVFWTFGWKALVGELRRFGYDVMDS